MEKRRFYLVLIGLLCMFAICCSESSDIVDEEGFHTQDLLADSVAIHEILQPHKIWVCGDDALVFSLSSSQMLFRYSLPDWTFVDTMGTQGEGPDDFSRFAFLLNTNRGGDLWFGDVMKPGLRRFSLTESGLDKKREVARPRGDASALGVVYNDSLIAYVVRSQDRSVLRTGSLSDSLRRIDSTACFSIGKMDIQNSASGEIVSVSVRFYNSPELRGTGDRLAVWYPDTENLYTYRIGKDGKLLSDGIYGGELSFETVAAHWEKNPDNPRSVRLLAVTDEHLYFFETEKDLNKKREGADVAETKYAVLKVRDWSMNPVKKFVLDKKNATQVVIDPNNEKIYAYDPVCDFEQVYVYDFKI